MCSICLRTPCHSRCPNAPEEREIEHCSLCDEGIFEGEDMVKIEGKWYHEDCLDKDFFIELLDLDIVVA